MDKAKSKGKLIKLPPDADIRIRLLDYMFGGITAKQFIEWLKSYKA